ncbi:hypothetical protein AB205_0191260 [Aquarana catesbeiana]|uniref:Uncharacterized protein n=1 Tax=Aquarana catesbeiana TaxID=8400 RepID=A0A2G9PJW7_AQUCT|nr:hypothetical protein AB205_0191260 [Aquarana catesbeiana]
MGINHAGCVNAESFTQQFFFFFGPLSLLQTFPIKLLRNTSTKSSSPNNQSKSNLKNIAKTKQKVVQHKQLLHKQYCSTYMLQVCAGSPGRLSAGGCVYVQCHFAVIISGRK